MFDTTFPATSRADASDAPALASALSVQRHRRHANPFTLRGEMAPLDMAALFGRTAPLALDIGCGPGEFTLALAQKHPEFNVLGVEIRPHFVARLEALSRQFELKNCRGLLANANLQLLGALPLASVAFVSINFPDPWYKKRHHKRRVVNATWLKDLRKHLMVGAELHTMTDYEPLALAMQEALETTPYLEAFERGFCLNSTTGLTSEREKTHMGRNEPIYRLAFRVRANEASE